MGVWWSLRVSPPVSTSSPAPLSFLTQLRSETTQPTVSLARCWYKLNVIPSQGSVINYPSRLLLCCQDWAVSVSRFQSSFSPLPLSRQLSDLWRPAHHLDWITTKLGLNFLNISHQCQSSGEFICYSWEIFAQFYCHHSISHFLWPSCRVCDTFHSRIAPGPQHPLADIFHLLRNFYQSSPVPRVPCAPVHMQILSPLHR